MDASLAILFAIVTSWDMYTIQCPVECFKVKEDKSELRVSYGFGFFQEERFGEEIYFNYGLNKIYGSYRPILGVSTTDRGAAWVGFGASFSKKFLGDRMYYNLDFIPGLYRQNREPILGNIIEFRASVELGFQLNEDTRLGVSFDHRSNGDISRLNPGFETLQLRFSVKL